MINKRKALFSGRYGKERGDDVAKSGAGELCCGPGNQSQSPPPDPHSFLSQDDWFSYFCELGGWRLSKPRRICKCESWTKCFQEPIWTLREEPVPNQRLGESQTFSAVWPLAQRRKVWNIKGLPDLERRLSPFSCYNKTQESGAEKYCAPF